MVKRAVITNFSSFTNDNTHAMINKKSITNDSTRVNFNTCHKTCKMCRHTGK